MMRLSDEKLKNAIDVSGLDSEQKIFFTENLTSFSEPIKSLVYLVSAKFPKKADDLYHILSKKWQIKDSIADMRFLTPGQKNELLDALHHLDIDGLKRLENLLALSKEEFDAFDEKYREQYRESIRKFNAFLSAVSTEIEKIKREMPDKI